MGELHETFAIAVGQGGGIEEGDALLAESGDGECFGTGEDGGVLGVGV